MNNIIKYTGLNDLDMQEQAKIKSVIELNYPKIQRLLKNIVNLSVHVKVYKKQEAKKKYSIHLKAEAPTSMLSAQAFDWDLARAVHSVTEKIIAEIQHKLKIRKKDSLMLKKVLRKAKRVKTNI